MAHLQKLAIRRNLGGEGLGSALTGESNARCLNSRVQVREAGHLKPGGAAGGQVSPARGSIDGGVGGGGDGGRGDATHCVT